MSWKAFCILMPHLLIWVSSYVHSFERNIRTKIRVMLMAYYLIKHFSTYARLSNVQVQKQGPFLYLLIYLFRNRRILILYMVFLGCFSYSYIVIHFWNQDLSFRLDAVYSNFRFEFCVFSTFIATGAGNSYLEGILNGINVIVGRWVILVIVFVSWV